MQNSYDYIADQWLANSRGQNYVDKVLAYVDRILVDLPRGSTVLDLGCGTGIPIGKYVVERGFHLVGVDESKKMLEIAQREVPEGEFIHADMVEVEFDDQFAGIVAWDSAFHVKRKHHSGLYHKLAKALDTGGRLLLSVGGSNSGDSTSGNLAAEGFYVRNVRSHVFL